MTPQPVKPADVIPRRFCRDCQQSRDAASFVRLSFANGRGSFEVCGHCVKRRKKVRRVA